MSRQVTRAAKTGHSQRLWPFFLFLLVAVVLPTTGVLWFMNEAMTNEQLAVRQRLTEVYQAQLQSASTRVQANWQNKVSLLMQAGQQNDAAAAFVDLVTNGHADSLLYYNQKGQLVYPNHLAFPQLQSEPETVKWLEARRLEYRNQLQEAAAKVYMQIAQQASNASESAQALLAQARCLSKAGQMKDAIEILTVQFSESRFNSASDGQGRMIVPNAWLMALELMKNPSHPAFNPTARRLFDRLNDYSVPLMPSSQRLFLMKQLQAQWPECPPFPTMAAEELAAKYLESNPTQLRAGELQPISFPGIWAFQTQDQRILALFQLDHLLAGMQAAIDAQGIIPETRFTLLPPDKAPSGIVPFLSISLAEELSSWQLILSLEGSDPFAPVSRQRIAAYLWIGILVTLLLVVLALTLAVYLRRQIRLTRLKNDLIATVSHELKTPLASMRLLVDTLLAGHYEDRQQIVDYLGLIGKENARLSSLIDNFLAFSRMERKKAAFDRSVVHAEEIVNAAVETIGDRLKTPSCQVKVDLDPELPAINGDRDALVTVVVNLLDNALKYSGDHKQIYLRSSASNGMVSIEVGDNGIGFSRRAAKRIFDRFYQVDRGLSEHAGGCGLGLSIVKFVVTAHGGSIVATSQPGKGSTFTVRLPAIAGNAIA